MRVSILDYDCGNIKSVYSAFTSLGCDCSIGLEGLSDNDILVIPGVGHYETAMMSLSRSGYINRILEHHTNGGRIIGICLGMQLLFETSEEASSLDLRGLGLVKGSVKKLLGGTGTINLGWKDTYSDDGIHSMYYVHQYYCEPENEEIETHYFYWGKKRVTSGIASGNIVGFQFHPEKSSSEGLNLLKECLV